MLIIRHVRRDLSAQHASLSPTQEPRSGPFSHLLTLKLLNVQGGRCTLGATWTTHRERGPHSAQRSLPTMGEGAPLCATGPSHPWEEWLSAQRLESPSLRLYPGGIYLLPKAIPGWYIPLRTLRWCIPLRTLRWCMPPMYLGGVCLPCT